MKLFATDDYELVCVFGDGSKCRFPVLALAFDWPPSYRMFGDPPIAAIVADEAGQGGPRLRPLFDPRGNADRENKEWIVVAGTPDERLLLWAGFPCIPEEGQPRKAHSYKGKSTCLRCSKGRSK